MKFTVHFTLPVEIELEDDTYKVLAQYSRNLYNEMIGMATLKLTDKVTPIDQLRVEKVTTSFDRNMTFRDEATKTGKLPERYFDKDK